MPPTSLSNMDSRWDAIMFSVQLASRPNADLPPAFTSASDRQGKLPLWVKEDITIIILVILIYMSSIGAGHSLSYIHNMYTL